MRAVAGANADPMHDGEDNGDDDSRGTPVPGERRPELLRQLAERDRRRRDGAARRHPVGPADHESRILAERSSCIDILSARLRDHHRHFGHRHGAEQRVNTARHPRADEPRGMGQGRRNVSDGPENSRPDRVADDDGEPEGYAKNLQQLRLALQLASPPRMRATDSVMISSSTFTSMSARRLRYKQPLPVLNLPSFLNSSGWRSTPVMI